MMKPDIPPPAYDLHELKASTVELAAHEITQSKEVLREKNAAREGKLYTSDWDAFIHIVKSSLGTGFLAMPDAFHNIGLLGGFIGTAVAAMVSTCCVSLVVKCSQELCYQKGKSQMGYPETVEAAFQLGAAGKLSRWSWLMRYVANFFMFVTYYGVNTAYVIFVASSLKNILEAHTEISMNIRLYVLLLLVVLLPVGIVRHIKFLVPFSVIANICVLIGCSLTLYLCCIDLPPVTSRPLIVDYTRWPLFFCTAIFGMEGIGTVLPIENAMRNPSHFLGCPGVLNFGMTVVATVFISVGTIGYLKFGDDILGSVTLNLPQDALSETVKALVAAAVIFTYPLQFTASVEVVWGGVSRFFSEKNQDVGYYITRTLMIVGTVALAILIPTLGPVISLVGAIGFSGLGLFLPCVTDLVLYWGSHSVLGLIRHGILLLFWILATVFGSWMSVHEIINEFNVQT